MPVGVVAEGVGLQHLADALVVGTRAAVDQGDVACGNVVAAFHSPFAINVEDGFQAKVIVTEFDDTGLRLALRGIHVADDVTARRGDALVAGEIEVHQRVQDVRCLVAGVVVGSPELHHGL